MARFSMKSEPITITFVVVAVLQYVFQVADVSVDSDMLEATVTGAFIIGGIVVSRRRAWSERTLRKAGLTPKSIEARVANEQINTIPDSVP